VSYTLLDNSSLQAHHHNQQRLPIVVRLLAQGSVLVLVGAFGWLGMAHLASSTLASQNDSLTAERHPIYVAGCPVVEVLEGSSAQEEGVGKDAGCSEEGSTHPITSRRPGGGLVEHGRRAERQREDKAPLRTSEHASSTHSHE
jgi:hypothetical protein